MMVSAEAAILVDDIAVQYVSRGALKLIAGLDHFGYDPSGRIALDLGASTGGFTEVLLERGAKHVFAIDVGHDQIAPVTSPGCSGCSSVAKRRLPSSFPSTW